MIGRARVKPQPVTVVDTSRTWWQMAAIVFVRLVVVLVRLVLRVAAWTAAYPVVLGPLLVVSVVWLRVGWPVAAVVVGLLVAGCTGMRLRWPVMFTRRVGLPARAFWSAATVYAPSWARYLHACGLSYREVDGELRAPRLLRVTSAGWLDRVHVRTLPGQHPGVFEAACESLAHTFGAAACRVRTPDPGRFGSGARRRVVLEFVTGRDPLRHLVPVPPAAADGVVDLAAVPVGRTESGRVWRLRLLGTHVLTVGATGAGKGSVIWSLLAGVAPAVRDGLVQVWAVDPKGGMELGLGRPLFARFAGHVEAPATGPGLSEAARGEALGGQWESIARLLEDAVLVMQVRASRLFGVTRQHAPSSAEPLVVIVVDEIAALTAYCPDRKIRARIDAALGLLLTQGRAVGVSVVAAVQDPRKEVLNLRDLFPVKLALRLDNAEQVDLVLGDGARTRGAYCDHISESTPGVGYVKEDGKREPIRVRAAYLDDDAVRQLARDFAPRSAGLRPVSDDEDAAA
jgi:S-DNA-T family DNA segregation ATPase FtsK/SpoIIIE